MSIKEIRTNAITGSYLVVEWYVKKTHIAENYTTIHYTLKGKREDKIAGKYRTVYDIFLKINGSVKLNQKIKRRVYHDTEITQGDINIWHEQNGQKNFTIEVKAGFGIYSGFNSSNSTSFSLPNIPRYVTIKQALNRVDLDNMAIHIDNPANQKYKLTLKDKNRNTVIRNIPNIYKNGWHSFVIDHNLIYNNHPNERVIPLVYEIYTYATDHIERREITYTIQKSQPKITEGIHLKDQWNKMKDNEASIVQKLSYPYITANPQSFKSSKGARITKVTFFAQGIYKTVNFTNQSTYIFGERFNNAGNTTATLRITDSRGLTAEKTTNITVIPYALPTIKADFNRLNNYEDTTSFNIKIEITKLKDFNNIDYVKYRYKEEKGEFNDFQILENVKPKDNKKTKVYAIPEFFKNLDNKKNWIIEIVARDSYLQQTQTYKVGKGTPFMFWSTTHKTLHVDDRKVILEDDEVIQEIKKELKGAIQVNIERDTDINTFVNWSEYNLTKLRINNPDREPKGTSLAHEGWGITVKRNMHALIFGQLAYKNLNATGKSDYYIKIKKIVNGGGEQEIYSSTVSEYNKWIGMIPFTFMHKFNKGEQIRFYLAVKGETTKKQTILNDTYLIAKEI